MGVTFRKMALVHGLLCTMNEVDVMEEWLQEHLPYFKHLVAIDNSNDGTREILEQTRGVIVLKQEELIDGPACDGIRQFGLDKLREIGLRDGDWIHLCHADEFLIHDPEFMVSRAVECNSDTIWWRMPFFYPTPEEGDRCFDLSLPIHERLRYWISTKTMLAEPRTIKVFPDIQWSNMHVMPKPFGRYVREVQRLSFEPALKHFPIRSPKHGLGRYLSPKRNPEGRGREYRWGRSLWRMDTREAIYRLVRHHDGKLVLYNPEQFEILG